MSLPSLTFDGVRKSYLVVTKRERSYWAERELHYRHTKTKSILKKITTQPRVEDVHVEVSSSPLSSLRENAEDLAGWLLHESEKELIFDDETNRRYYAVVDGGFNPEEIVTHGYGRIRFIIPNGSKLGTDHTITAEENKKTFGIRGQAKTPWTSRTVLQQPTEQFSLELGGQVRIILNYDFVRGDTLEIDAETRKVFLNGSDLATAVSLDSEWGKGVIATGDLSVVASHETTISYTERYL